MFTAVAQILAMPPAVNQSLRLENVVMQYRLVKGCDDVTAVYEFNYDI